MCALHLGRIQLLHRRNHGGVAQHLDGVGFVAEDEVN
jgi:hypothetical protein